MPVFVAIHPHALVNSLQVKAIIETISFRSTATDILAKHGINKPESGMWYSQQYWLDAIKEISERFLPPTIYSIGLTIAGYMTFPSYVKSFKMALASMNQAYTFSKFISAGNIRYSQSSKKYNAFNYYNFSMIDKKVTKIICQNPHPCDFDAGIISEIINRYPSKCGQVKVIHNDLAPCRKYGAESCEFIIR
jgi:hypothetical protein